MYDFRKSKTYLKLKDIDKDHLLTKELIRPYTLLLGLLTDFPGSIFRPVLLTGRPGLGKHTALATALKEEINIERKANVVNLGELIKDGEFDLKLFIKMIRSTVEIQIKETQKIIEGEVINITADKIHLKTMDMESVFDVGVRMGKELETARVCVGDVVKIYKESCFVTRIGRASGHNPSFRSELLPIVPLPEGECIKNENCLSTLTLDELDLINYKENGEEYLYTGQVVNEYIQTEVDKKVNKWIKEGKANLRTGVLIFENTEYLTKPILLKMQYAMKSLFKPSFVFFYNLRSNITPDCSSNIIFSEYQESELKDIIISTSGSVEDSTTDFLIEMAITKGLKKTFKLIDSVQKPFSLSSLKKMVDLFDF